MTIENPNQFKASAELTQTILTKLTTERGVHAETAISAAARMAGTYMLRSSGLPLERFTPGTPVFSDIMNERGPLLLRTVDEVLESMNIAINPRRVDCNIPDEHQPHMDLLEMQTLLDPAFEAVFRKYQLTVEEGAYAAAIGTAVMIQKTAGVINPYLGYAIAANGIVESCKTVPVAAVAA
jgi:hypothetical protein